MILSWSLLLCAAAASLIQAFFISRIRRTGAKNYLRCPSQEHLPGVSVIVCAKNEAENLNKLIPEILNQRHSNFELILVNDHSSDQTQQVVEQWAKRDPRVRTFTLKEKFKTPGKKAALSFGISQAAHDLLLLTDADCLPASADWIDLMTSPLRANKSVVLGYGGYIKTSGVLNSVIRFETTLTAGLFLGQALAGHPYMGVGRNLAYRKDFFTLRADLNLMSILLREMTICWLIMGQIKITQQWSLTQKPILGHDLKPHGGVFLIKKDAIKVLHIFIEPRLKSC